MPEWSVYLICFSFGLIVLACAIVLLPDKSKGLGAWLVENDERLIVAASREQAEEIYWSRVRRETNPAPGFNYRHC